MCIGKFEQNGFWFVELLLAASWVLDVVFDDRWRRNVIASTALTGMN
jgi:hypothetical protein